MNLGKEDVHKDLTLLCKKCDKNYHRFVKRKKEKPKKKKRQSLAPVGSSVRQKLWWKEQEKKYKEIHPRPKRGSHAEERSIQNKKNRPKLTQETLKEGQKSCSVHKRTVYRRSRVRL